MIKLINTFRSKSYFYKDENSLFTFIDEYKEGENINFHFEDDEYNIEIESKDIHIDNCGNIYFLINDDKYIVDDGYRNLLTKSGYIIRDKYDFERIADPEKGKKIINDFEDDIFKTIDDLNYETIQYQDNFYIKINERYFLYYISFTNIDELVEINKIRKINKQPFYPFDKSMDKFGTNFMSIYTKRLNNVAKDIEKYNKSDKIVSELLQNLNKYH
jgi:hypothetical protein